MSAKPVLHLGRYVARSWTPKDRKPLIEMVTNILASHGLQFQPDDGDQDALRVEEYYWGSGKGDLFVIEDVAKQEMVGCVGYYNSTAQRGERCADIRKMYLKPEARGKGIAQFMLTMIEEEIRRSGVKKVFIETSTTLDKACRLYERAGYTDASGENAMLDSRSDKLLTKTLN
ncbi:uncharacterized N-acetyltransferase YjgM-like [Oscarella lobularis]|uniref:uncharacterized N-acetyltransferase YjgM-like n=1 Tax=Oscarella lobularis TaxID=121494 RepID=UPI0033140B11